MRKSLTALNQLKTAWLLVFVLAITTDAEQWKIISDFRDVREVVYADGRLYCATSGGLAEFDPETELFILHDPADGFAGIGVSALAEDGAGGLWLAFDNGRLQRFEPGRGVTHSVQSLGPETGITHINRMTVSPWGIFLATNCGIARVIYSLSLIHI